MHNRILKKYELDYRFQTLFLCSHNRTSYSRGKTNVRNDNDHKSDQQYFAYI